MEIFKKPVQYPVRISKEERNSIDSCIWVLEEFEDTMTTNNVDKLITEDWDFSRDDIYRLRTSLELLRDVESAE